jgi:hypothetical protein
MKKLVPSLDWGKFDIEHRQKASSCLVERLRRLIGSSCCATFVVLACVLS